MIFRIVRPKPTEAERIAAMMDLMEMFNELVVGYRTRLLESEFSPQAAEIMTVEFHRMLLMKATIG